MNYLFSAAVFVAIAASWLIPVAQAADAASTYPSRPVRLMVPYPPGGATDTVARIIAQKLSALTGQQFVVDNRSGAGGIIGTQTAAKAAPDGYTLLLGTSSGLVINPLVRSKLPYDPVKDFAPVSMLAINPTMLVVHPSLPVNSVSELIAYAKSRPGKLNYASVGAGTPIHLGMESFKSMTGTDIVHVAYKGTGPALTDLLGGQVQLMFNSMPPLLPHIRAGRLKALAVGSPQRSPAVPDIPTVAEAGVPGFQTVTWFGIFVPTGTPKSIINKLNTQIVRALEDRELAQNIASQGSEPQSSTSERMAQYMREDSKRWEKVIRAARITVE